MPHGLSKRLDWIFPGLLTLVLALLYAAGVDGPLLFDSKIALLRNPDLHLDPSGFNQWIVASTSSTSGPTGRPVTMFTFALNHALSGGVNIAAVKWTNVMLHSVAAAVMYSLLKGIFCHAPACSAIRFPRAMAMTTVAWWALHPLQVSTVLYSVQRMEMLSALFILCGLLFWVRCRLPWLERSPTPEEISRSLCGLLVFLLLAVFAKEDGILLLPLLVLTELLLFRCRFGASESSLLQRAAVLSLLLGTALGFTLCLFPPEWLQQAYAGREFTLTERMLTQARVLWQYVAWLLWPLPQNYALHHDSYVLSRSLLAPPSTLLAVAAWLLCLGLVIWRWRVWTIVAFSLGWYLLAHSVESTLLPLEMAYEHRNYLPSMSVALLLSAVFWQWLPRLTPVYRTALVLCTLLVVSLLTWQRAALWADEERMSAQHLRWHPDSVRSVYHYANTQLRLGESAEDDEGRRRISTARKYYEHMQQLDPANLPALITLLYIDSRYYGGGEADRWVNTLLDLPMELVIGSDDRNALDLLLQCMTYEWCAMDEASFERFLDDMTERDPREPLYRSVLAFYVGDRLHDYDRAIAIHQQVLERHPSYRPALQGLVRWYQASGNHGQAIESLRRMLREDTSSASVQRVRAVLVPAES